MDGALRLNYLNGEKIKATKQKVMERQHYCSLKITPVLVK